MNWDEHPKPVVPSRLWRGLGYALLIEAAITAVVVMAVLFARH